MTARKGKKRSQKRKAVRGAKVTVRVSRKAKAKPPRLSLTDRMREQGVVKTCWYTTDLCDLCGGQMATNGQTRWCVSRMHA